MNKQYKGIDLFCGIGGFRLAMEECGVECVFSSDNDKFAQETYNANFNEIPAGDIKKIRVDLTPFVATTNELILYRKNIRERLSDIQC